MPCAVGKRRSKPYAGACDMALRDLYLTTMVMTFAIQRRAMQNAKQTPSLPALLFLFPPSTLRIPNPILLRLFHWHHLWHRCARLSRLFRRWRIRHRSIWVSRRISLLSTHIQVRPTKRRFLFQRPSSHDFPQPAQASNQSSHLCGLVGAVFKTCAGHRVIGFEYKGPSGCWCRRCCCWRL